MTALVFDHKRGDSFELVGQLLESATGPAVNLAGVTLAAQIRDGEAVIADLLVEVVDAADGRYRLAADYTAAETWPVKTLALDVQFTFPGPPALRRSSETVVVRVVKDITR